MEEKTKIVLIDDDYVLRKACETILTDAGFEVVSCKNVEEALRSLRGTSFDIAITDYRMPGMNGLEFMRVLANTSPQTDVIMITGYATIERAVEAMRYGAFDYLQKPFELEQLVATVKKLVAKRQKIGKASGNELRFEFEGNPVSMIGKSTAMQNVFRIVEKVAPSESNILILGQSGTGKELIAKAIHRFSKRHTGPFFAMDCGSLVETLFESELFGHVKGSFTGATATKHGALELAEGGTFFFDEIGNISMNIQAKILRAIQEKEIERVGGTETIKIDVRIIAATNLDLKQAVDNGQFREDLYYRLSVIPIKLPTLKERKEDVPLLIDHFIQRNNRRRSKKPIKSVDEAAMQAMLAYDWPGNIRELENVMERASVIEDSASIRLSSLPAHIQQISPAKPEKNPIFSMADMEKQHIAGALAHTDYNISQAAKLLGIDRKTLYDKNKKYKISTK